MPPVVSLRELIDALGSQSDQCRSYVNRKTGECFFVSDEDEWAAGEEDPSQLPEWQREANLQIREVLDSEDWLELPGRFEVNEYRIMERFCLSVESAERRDQLLDAIRGRGAFRRFKDAIWRMGIEDDWYRFRDQELAEIGIAWLKERGISYKNDV